MGAAVIFLLLSVFVEAAIIMMINAAHRLMFYFFKHLNANDPIPPSYKKLILLYNKTNFKNIIK